jgi:hypothetical protein
MTDTIRTRTDGSIDTDHYIARGRHLRSRKAHAMARSSGSVAAGARRPARTLPILVVLATALLLAAALPLST